MDRAQFGVMGQMNASRERENVRNSVKSFECEMIPNHGNHSLSPSGFIIFAVLCWWWWWWLQVDDGNDCNCNQFTRQTDQPITWPCVHPGSSMLAHTHTGNACRWLASAPPLPLLLLTRSQCVCVYACDSFNLFLNVIHSRSKQIKAMCLSCSAWCWSERCIEPRGEGEWNWAGGGCCHLVH